MKSIIHAAIAVALCCAALGPARAATAPAAPQAEHFDVYRQQTLVGRLVVRPQAEGLQIEFDVKDNGRGPTIAEQLQLDAEGLPLLWKIDGTQTFGGKVAERFERLQGQARWQDAAGPGQASGGAQLYVAQAASPWALQVYARALLRAGGPLEVLPGGTLSLSRGETLQLRGPAGDVAATRYELSGLGLNPTTLLLDDQARLLALPTPGGVVVRRGFEGENARLMQLAAEWQSARWATIQREAARRFEGPVRLRNVRVFDPQALRLSEPVAVLVHGREIASIQPLDAPATPGETLVEGEGGTLVPGMFEMHGHLGESAALLNLLAGVTSVRDMGGQNPVLAALERRIESGEIAGPRILKSGFIEGKSPFSANLGYVVDSQAQALEAVRWYAARGYPQIKIYNSIDPAWVPAMVAEARRLGLRTMGHVPAFSTADAMLAAGYDEITHINQLALGWIIEPGEDTRTLFRLTALGRLPALDLDSAPVQRTLQTMKTRGVALDATLGIHENLLLNRDGSFPSGATDYAAHMPVSVQRSMKQSWSNPSAFGGDANARAAFDKLLELVRRAHAQGIFIVPGTDTGGSFSYHRELELYTRAGFTPAQVLARATLDMARYLGRDQRLGSIERGKLADFFLVPGDPTQDIKAIKTIRLVARDGVFYLPGEVYPRLDIKPFASAPLFVPPAPGEQGTLGSSSPGAPLPQAAQGH